MYFVLVALLSASALFVCQFGGTRRAIWFVWCPALLLPCSSVRWVGGMELTLPTVVAGVILVCSFLQNPNLHWHWRLPDYLVAGLAIVSVASEGLRGHGMLVHVEVARRWLMPYLMGRLALEPTDYGDRLPDYAPRVLAFVCTAAAGLSIFEAVGHVNPYWVFTGLNEEFLIRFGLRRSSGPSEHPIGFGMLFVALMPWALQAAKRSWDGEAPRWWLLVPVLLGAGLFCTVSRGAWIGAAVAVTTAAWCWIRWIRFPLVAGLVLCVSLGYLFSSKVVDGLNALAGDSSAKVLMISIDGKDYKYTGTNHRYLQFLVYRKLIRKAGAFGYGNSGMHWIRRGAEGTEYVADLPPNVPSSFWSIDSHYLQTLLLRGWGGIGLWILLSAQAAFVLARPTYGPDEFARYTVCGGILGVMVGLLTVYSLRPADESLLFLTGLAAAWNARPWLDPDGLWDDWEEPLPETADLEITTSPKDATAADSGDPYSSLEISADHSTEFQSV